MAEMALHPVPVAAKQTEIKRPTALRTFRHIEPARRIAVVSGGVLEGADDAAAVGGGSLCCPVLSLPPASATCLLESAAV